MTGSTTFATPRERIAEELRRTSTKVVVFDDDPTGSQTVAGVPILLGWEDDDLRWGLSDPAGVLFILTNSRSMGAIAAAALTRDLAGRCAAVAGELGIGLRFVSRSDSTLRGHFPAEVEALDRGLRDAGAPPSDGTILCPCYLEAGRITVDDVHYVRAADGLVPVGETEFARDAAFGYAASNLAEWVVERTRDSVPAIGRITLSDLRKGGPDAVARILVQLPPGAVTIVNATSYEELDTMVLGLQAAESTGRRFIYRTGPSFVPVRAGMIVPEPLVLGPDGVGGGGRGLVVVGSHTGLTSRQLARAASDHGLNVVEARVAEIAGGARRAFEERSRVLSELRTDLAAGDAVLATTRTRADMGSPETSLRLNETISAFLVDVTRALLAEADVGFLLAKGGITSSVLATDALGAVRAHVDGQLFPSTVSLWSLELDDREAQLPFVVFPGNVGDDGALSDALTALKGRRVG